MKVSLGEWRDGVCAAFAASFAAARRRAGLSRYRAAKQIGLPVNTLWRWEVRHDDPRLSNAALAVRALGVRLEDVFGDAEVLAAAARVRGRARAERRAAGEARAAGPGAGAKKPR